MVNLRIIHIMFDSLKPLYDFISICNLFNFESEFYLYTSSSFTDMKIVETCYI